MIRLKNFEEKDYDQLISWVESEEALMQFAGPAFTFPLTHEQLRFSLSDSKRIAFKVVEVPGDISIGHAEIYLADSTAYLGRILIGLKHLRGTGIGQKIVKQLLEYTFITLSRDKVELNVFEWNISAIKCYEKAGFTINPDKKAARKVNDQTWIAINMNIEKIKWQERLQFP